MATSTQEVQSPAGGQSKVHIGAAKAAAGARASEALDAAPAAEAELCLAEARLYLTMRRRVFHWLMAMTTLTVAAALAAVFLNGFGLTQIPEGVVITLLALTVAKTTAMFLTVVKHLFPALPPRRPAE